MGHKKIESYLNRSFNSLKGLLLSLKDGRALQTGLRSYFSSGGGSALLPRYKFFTTFCFELRELQLRHGIPSRKIIFGLRDWITKDIQFEEKVQGLLQNSLFQFLILSSFTWIFYFNATSSLDCEIPWRGFATLQVCGIVSFLYVYQKQRTSFFSGLDELLKKVFLFQSLKKVGLSMGEVLIRSGADQELLSNDKEVKELSSQLSILAQDWTKQGRSIDAQLEELSNELTYLRETKRKSFELKLAVLRFMHLVGFYLVGYFLVILALIEQLALSY